MEVKKKLWQPGKQGKTVHERCGAVVQSSAGWQPVRKIKHHPRCRSEGVSKNGKCIPDVGTAMTCIEVNNGRKGAKSSTAKYGSSYGHPCNEQRR